MKTSTSVVYITGAAQGIGYSIATHLAGIGYRVYAMVRSSSNCSDLDQAVEKYSPRLIKLIGDVTDAHSIEENIAHIISESGRLDVVINKDVGIHEHKLTLSSKILMTRCIRLPNMTFNKKVVS